MQRQNLFMAFKRVFPDDNDIEATQYNVGEKPTAILYYWETKFQNSGKSSISPPLFKHRIVMELNTMPPASQCFSSSSAERQRRHISKRDPTLPSLSSPR